LVRADFPGDLEVGPFSGETGSETSAIVSRCNPSPVLLDAVSSSDPWAK